MIYQNYSRLFQSIEAEEAILGGILLDPDAITLVESELIPEAFAVIAHQHIYRTALTLHRQGQPTDLVTVTIFLSDHHLLDAVGGTTKLSQLLNRTVSATNIDRYAKLVHKKYLRRQLQIAANDIQELIHDTTLDNDLVIEKSEKKLFKISNQRTKSETQHNSEIIVDAFNDLEKDAPIYPTGFYDLDDLLVGFEPGTMTILAGRPSMGKSAIGLNLALSMAVNHQLPVVIFSLEMTKKQLEYRLWSLLSITEDTIPIEGERIRRHRANLDRLSPEEMESIVSIMAIASELPIYMNDSRDITVSNIASACRQIKAHTGKLGLVVVDYLQMMASDEPEGNRSYELGNVARGLYKLAGDLDVPVLALSQINRGVEGRQNKRPMMADLSQSGILEMVADNIIMAYRDEYYDSASIDQGLLELIVAKARHGNTGTVKVLFDRSYGVMRNLG